MKEALLWTGAAIVAMCWLVAPGAALIAIILDEVTRQ